MTNDGEQPNRPLTFYLKGFARRFFVEFVVVLVLLFALYAIFRPEMRWGAT